MQFAKWLESANPVFTVSLAKLYGWKDKILEVVKDFENNRLTHSAGQPVTLSRLDNPKGAFYIIDGYHRVVEAMLANQTGISATINEFVPRIERTGGAYQVYVTNKVRILDTLSLFRKTA